MYYIQVFPNSVYRKGRKSRYPSSTPSTEILVSSTIPHSKEQEFFGKTVDSLSEIKIGT